MVATGDKTEKVSETLRFCQCYLWGGLNKKNTDPNFLFFIQSRNEMLEMYEKESFSHQCLSLKKASFELSEVGTLWK